jgi:hypothetical protein
VTDQKTTRKVSVRRTDERRRAPGTRDEQSIAGARNWLRDAHRQSGSWDVVAKTFQLSSKGSARRIALGEADLPLRVLERFLELRIWRSAARELEKRARARAISDALARAGQRVVTYDNRGKEVKG